MTNIFLTYIGISVTVGIVVLLILLASPFINRRYAAKWKYYIWIFLAIRLLIPVSGMYHKQSEAPVISNTVQSSGAAVYEPVEVQKVQPRRFVVEIPIEATGQIAKTPDTNSVRPKPSLFDLIFAVWIAGGIIFVSIPIAGCLHYKYRITKGGERIESGEAFETFLRMKSQLRIRRKVSLIRYARAASPMIIGFIRPALVLPSDDFSGEELQFIIRHELIHLKRGDVYIKLLCVLANGVHWFNPLIWIMRREAAIDMELSCDEGVIKGADIGVKKAYTETLMSSLRRQSSKRSSLTTQFYGGKGTMKKRFTNILGKGAKKNGIAVLICAVILATLLGVLVGCTQKASDNEADIENFTDSLNTADEQAVPIDNGTSELSDEEMNRLISEYLRFEMYTVYGCVSFGSNDPDNGVWIGDTFVQEIELDGSYHPSIEEGLTTWQEWLDFINGIFTDDTAEKKLNDLTGEGKRYKDVNGSLYILPSGGMGWPYTSPVQAGYKTDGSTGIIEFWREDIGEGSEWWYYITTFDIRLTDSGWRIQSVEGRNIDSIADYPDDFKPLLDKPYQVDKSAYTVNQIYRRLMYDYYETVNILSFNACESAHVMNGVDQIGNLREIEGETYIPMVESYDTPEEIKQQLSLVFTKQKCDELYKQFFEENDNLKVIDGRFYCPWADVVRIPFKTPFESAVQISDSEILAKTVVEYDDKTVPCEITFKYEDGEWKIDRLVEYMSEEGRERSY